MLHPFENIYVKYLSAIFKQRGSDKQHTFCPNLETKHVLQLKIAGFIRELLYIRGK
jgi:hypothetical protein